MAADGPFWLPSFVAPASSNPDGGDHYGILCGDCGAPIMLFCIDCGGIRCRHCHPDGGHRTLRVAMMLGEMSVACDAIEKLVDVSDVRRYYSNAEFLVFLDRPAAAERWCLSEPAPKCLSCDRAMIGRAKAGFHFCSIACKLRHIRKTKNPKEGYTLSPLGGSGGGGGGGGVRPSRRRPRSPAASASGSARMIKPKGRLIQRFLREQNASPCEIDDDLTALEIDAPLDFTNCN